MILLFLNINLLAQSQPLRNSIGELILKIESSEAFEIPVNPIWVWKFKEIPPGPDGVVRMKAEIRKITKLEKWWLDGKSWIQGIFGLIVTGLGGGFARYFLKHKKLKLSVENNN